MVVVVGVETGCRVGVMVEDGGERWWETGGS